MSDAPQDEIARDEANGEWANQRIAELEAELVQAKANHANLVEKNAVLRQRPDLPVDRIPAYEAMVKERDALRDLVCRAYRAYRRGEAMGPLGLLESDMRAVSEKALKGVEDK